MTLSAPGGLAFELRPTSPTHWVATYYAMVVTPAVRWAEVAEELLSIQGAQPLRKNTFLVPAGQLSEWVLDDLQDETSTARAGHPCSQPHTDVSRCEQGHILDIAERSRSEHPG